MRSVLPHLLGFTVLAGSAAAQTTALLFDPIDDAGARVIDPQGQLSPTSTVPDVLLVVMSTWTTPTPTTNPYAGTPIDWKQAHLVRLDVVFRGLVNPPGPIDGVTVHEPFLFGDNPVYGYIDIDMDGRKDTGGEIGTAALNRYLSSVGRFGRIPHGSLGERAARSAGQLDLIFATGPQYERSGADFSLVLCGCQTATIVEQTGNMDGKLDKGEVMVLSDRYFARSGGYSGASFVSGGSATWRYDPIVKLRFTHDIATDQTIVSLVFPLDMVGAKLLGGLASVPPVNYNAGDAVSIEEAFQDTIDYYDSFTPPEPTFTLTEKWEGRDAEDAFDPSDWTFAGLVGLPYLAVTPNGSRFSWSDTCGDELHGDIDGDGLAGELDEDAVKAYIYAHDGTSADADGLKDGLFTLMGFGVNFVVEDLDGNGIVEAEDLWTYGHRADTNKDGKLDFFDFLAFQMLFVTQNPDADFNIDGVIDIFDFLEFQTAFNR